jgi:hypothetical protein
VGGPGQQAGAHLPKLGTNLVAALAALDVDDLTHDCFLRGTAWVGKGQEGQGEWGGVQRQAAFERTVQQWAGRSKREAVEAQCTYLTLFKRINMALWRRYGVVESHGVWAPSWVVDS